MNGLDALASSFGLPPAIASDPTLLTSRGARNIQAERPGPVRQRALLELGAEIAAQLAVTGKGSPNREPVELPEPADEAQKVLAETKRSELRREGNKTKIIAARGKKEAGWARLPGAEKTPELLRDIEVVRRRASLDPSKHYRQVGWAKGKTPRVAQGEVILSAYEQHKQMPRKMRGRTLFDEFVKNDPNVRTKLKKRAKNAYLNGRRKTMIKITHRRGRKTGRR